MKRRPRRIMQDSRPMFVMPPLKDIEKRTLVAQIKSWSAPIILDDDHYSYAIGGTD